MTNKLRKKKVWVGWSEVPVGSWDKSWIFALAISKKKTIKTDKKIRITVEEL